MQSAKKNIIYLNYNGSGYCIEYKEKRSKTRLTCDGLNEKFVSPLEAVSKLIEGISLDFYSGGVEIKTASSAPENETRAFAGIIRRLEEFAQEGATCAEKLGEIARILHK